MKKFISILLCVFIILSFTMVPVSAAPKTPKVNGTITVTKVVENDSKDTTKFTVTLYKADGTKHGEGMVSQGVPLKFTKLPAGTYTLKESAKDGYEQVSISPESVTVKESINYNITVINKKVGLEPPPDDPPQSTSIHYVALGDSLATGTTSRGTTKSYIYGFYANLKTIYPGATVTMANLSNNGDTSADLLLKISTTFLDEIKKANVITICIGGNNVLNAARDSYFTRINATIAEDGTKAFENEYASIIAAIRAHNTTAKIVSMTLYNPYNSIDISGYRGDAALHSQAKPYIERINNTIKGITDSNYKVADVYSHFLNNYGAVGKMGSITYFYPTSLLKITRDPHPNQTGQNIMTTIHTDVFKTFK